MLKLYKAVAVCLVLLGAVLGGYFTSGWYQGTTVEVESQYVKATDDEMARNAVAIVEGTVAKIHPSYVSEADPKFPMVYTEIEIAVKEVLKGSVPTRLLVRVPGGTAGKLNMKVEAGPSTWTPNSKVILFLAQDGSGIYSLWAGPYGKFVIENGLAHNTGSGNSKDLNQLMAVIAGARERK